MSIKAKINAALEKIGKSNGHAAPKTQDPLDADVHEYMVATIGESYFKKRRELAKKTLLGKLSDDANERIKQLVKNVKTTEIAENTVILECGHYNLDAAVKNGASFLDTQALKVALMKKLPSDEVEKLFNDNTKRRDPSITYTAVEK